MRSMARTANRAARDLRNAANAARRSATELNHAARNANNAGRSMRGLGQNAQYAEQKLNRLAQRLRTIRSIRYGATGMFAGLGTGIMAQRVGSTLIGYEKSMNMVAANMVSHMDGNTPILKGIKGETALEKAQNSKAMMAALRDETKRVARESIFDPSEVSAGLLELARAGANPYEAMEMLHPAVRLAAAGNLGVGEAVDIATNITKSFGFEVTETTRIVDVLAQAASNANTTVHEMGQAMKFAAPSATSAGRSMEETTAVIMSLAKRGLKASIGGTSVARMLESIYKRSGPAVKALKGIGLAHKDFMGKDGKTIPIVEMLKKFKEAAAVYGDEKVIMAIQTMMGSRGSRAAKLLYKSSIEELKANKKLLEMAEGRAALMEKMMMTGVYGAYEKMRASIVESIISLGEGGLAKDLEYLANKIREMANSFSKLDPSTQKLIGRLLLFATALTAIGLPLGIFLFSLSSIAAVLATLASPIALAVLAIAGLAWWLTDGFDFDTQSWRGYFSVLTNHAKKLKAEYSNGWDKSEIKSFLDYIGDKISGLASKMPGLFEKLATSTNPLATAFRKMIDWATELIGLIKEIPHYLMNPSRIITDSTDWIGEKAKSALQKLKEAGATLPIWSGSEDGVKTPGAVAKSQTEKELSLRVQTENNVKVEAPASIVLKGLNGATAGTIPLKAGVASRGVTTPEAIGP